MASNNYVACIEKYKIIKKARANMQGTVTQKKQQMDASIDEVKVTFLAFLATNSAIKAL